MVRFNRRISNFVISACIAVALASAAPAAVADDGATANNGWPQWLADAMGEENLRIRIRKVVLEDGLIKTRMAGKAAGKPQQIDGGWYLPRDIGTGAPLECWAFTASVDPATIANTIAEQILSASQQANGPLVDRSLYFVDAGAIDGAPFLALEWIYSVGEEPEVRVGLAKVRVAVKDEFSFACAHNFVGYRETFALAFEHFVREAKVKSSEPAPYYQEIFVQRLGEQPIGVSLSTFTLDEDGDTRIEMMETSLIPVDGATLATSDTWFFGWSSPDGRLINQRVAKSENGELTMNLALDPLDAGLWGVSGTFQGKEIAHEIVHDSAPMSELGQMLAVQDLLADGDRVSTSVPVWMPAADPTGFIEAEVALEPEGREDGLGRLTMGPLSIDARFDPSGSLMAGTLQAGAAQLVLERVWVNGTLP
ncbi:MAG: hypothetical protein QNJ73_03590 [Gammaproteobacteria bacterium]|nr:hypothetical protein [Gammaproteobacteria bacterium]